jgi:hypothetical protein
MNANQLKSRLQKQIQLLRLQPTLKEICRISGCKNNYTDWLPLWVIRQHFFLKLPKCLPTAITQTSRACYNDRTSYMHVLGYSNHRAHHLHFCHQRIWENMPQNSMHPPPPHTLSTAGCALHTCTCITSGTSTKTFCGYRPLEQLTEAMALAHGSSVCACLSICYCVYTCLYVQEYRALQVTCQKK